jgi:hypothetical protein
MDESERRITEAIAMTRVLRPPKQHLATFGVTNVKYYLVTDPSYRDLVPGEEESVVREGRVISQRPAIVTPTYMMNLEGFSENARKYMEHLAQRQGPNSPGILYRYRNEPGGLDIVGDGVQIVARRISDDLDKRGEDIAAVIIGADDLWDVSVLKFIYEYTASSLVSNVSEMQTMGMLQPDPGTDVPRGVIRRIEEMFRQVRQGLDPKVLKEELDRWGLFEHYEARFLGLFRKK